MDEQELVPLKQVLEDMNGDGYQRVGARLYYKEHYATEEEKIKMDLEDLWSKIIGIGLLASIGILLICVAFGVIG